MYKCSSHELYLRKPERESRSCDYMRGEPIGAMVFTLIHGLRPEFYRKKQQQTPQKSNNGNINKSHISNRVSLGRGQLRNNAASMEQFGGQGNVIYIIDKAIEYSKTFRPNSEHSNNAEFLIKGVNPNLIKALIVHDVDRHRLDEIIFNLKKLILINDPSLGVVYSDKEKQEKINFINSLPIISFEEEVKK